MKPDHPKRRGTVVSIGDAIDAMLASHGIDCESWKRRHQQPVPNKMATVALGAKTVAEIQKQDD